MAESRITLEKFELSDFPQYFQLTGNRRVMAMITEKATPLEEARKNFKNLMTKNDLHKNFGSFKVLEKKTSQFMGLAKLETEDASSREAELGYMLLPEFWGKGYGSEIAQLMIRKGRLSNQLNIIQAIIDPENIPSRRILVKYNFDHQKDFVDNNLAAALYVLKL